MINSFEIGTKLYTCPEWHLLVFPTEERAATVPAVWLPWAGTTTVAAESAWWSKELGYTVSVIPAGRVFCVAEIGETDKFYGYQRVHVVSGEGIGWINVWDWLNIKELVA